jgi:hypothetical protein
MAIMKKLNAILKISGLMSTALVLMTISGEAASNCRKMGLSKAECACSAALSTGSQSALRKFLQVYPGSDTACNAMASTAPTITFVPERDREGGNADQNNGGRQRDR